MTPLRLVASDIDGTLVDAQGDLAPETVRVLQALLAREIPVVLVTGLNPWPAMRYVREIDTRVRAICLNGIFLVEDGHLIEGEFLAPALVERAVAAILAAGATPLVYGEDGISRYLPTSEGMTVLEPLIMARPYQPFDLVHSEAELLTVRPAQVSVCETSERGAALYPQLEAALGAEAYVVYQPGSERTWVEVNHRNARKDVALLALAARLGVAPAEVLYFGDSLNDLPVFERVPHAVAMSNGREEIKERAWRIAPANDEAGVAQMLCALFDVPPEA